MTWHRLDASSCNTFSFYDLSFSYNQAHLIPDVPKYFSRRILQVFVRFPKGFDCKYDCYDCFRGYLGIPFGYPCFGGILALV